MKPRNWLDLAKNDIQFCEVMEQQLPQEYAKAGLCFHTQQAVEKLLKGILSANGRDVKCADIFNLAEMCDKYTNAVLPSELINISNILTAWGNGYMFPDFDNDVYQKAKEITLELVDILRYEIKMNTSMVDPLGYKINKEYMNKYKEWLQMCPEELIDKSDEISVCKFIRDHTIDSFTEKEAEYFLQFKESLQVLADRIPMINDPENIEYRERFFDIVTEMYDKQDEYADYELSEGIQMQ